MKEVSATKKNWYEMENPPHLHEQFRKTRRTEKEWERIRERKKQKLFCTFGLTGHLVFTERFPDFPLYFQGVTLLLLIIPLILEFCIRHIHQIVQVLKLL